MNRKLELLRGIDLKEGQCEELEAAYLSHLSCHAILFALFTSMTMPSSSSSVSTGMDSSAYDLAANQLDEFHRQGFLLLPDFFDPAPLLEQSKHLVENFDLEGHPLTKFTTGEDEAGQVGDDYFLQSGDKVRWFLEEEAVKDGKLVRPKERAVNKVGHGEDPF